MTQRIQVVAIGGTTRPNSSSEKALRIAAQASKDAGAQVSFITGADLLMPIYDTQSTERAAESLHLIEQIRNADGVLISSPGYHGGMSGLIKNAIDYLEDLSGDRRPYLDGRAVGCVAVAHGWQASVTTLHQLRHITHALRGWPTPMGAAVNTAETQFSADGTLENPAANAALTRIGAQVVDFAEAFTAHRN
ncbi:MAG: NAD(P)H-dependent oxidoreductase [Candidatus Nanopelagicales bacterium]|nr:NAD(P)H-dependent oxidoreductase [Actinomycetota bacterium]MDA9334276.1 NAD(P)H-dependent oxidoreductase [Actinomycetota bacterium]MDB9921460.1 NAD(P)H-dependent oxidoreductase [Actinomycetota bacterium]